MLSRELLELQRDTGNSKHKDEGSLRCELGLVPKSRNVTT